MNIAAQCRPHGAELRLRFPDDFHDILRPFAEEFPFRRQSDVPVASDQKFLPQLLFELLQLTGEGGLGDVKKTRGAKNGAFTGRRQKISQYS